MKQILKLRGRMVPWKITNDPFIRVTRRRSYPLVEGTKYLGLRMSIGMKQATGDIVKATEAKLIKTANLLKSKSAKLAAVAQMVYLASVFRYYCVPLVLTELMDVKRLQ